MNKVEINVIGYKNLDRMKNTTEPYINFGGDVVYRPDCLKSLKGLYYRGQLVGFRIQIIGKEIIDIGVKTLRAFQWKLEHRRGEFLTLEDFNGLVATKKEIITDSYVKDISKDFYECVELIKILGSNTQTGDIYDIESIKKLAKFFYNNGGDIIVECWEDKYIKEMIDKSNILNILQVAIAARVEEIEDYKNGAGYYW